ncbi:MAG: PD-(D/E)XK nuclease family protein [Clostridia bacterium]|nr:PD-(D/E)XK nuclease family protein [Clostridia bacterium]
MKAALEFILGRSGTGKTETIISRIAELKASGSDAECFVIVPEQASFETERRLAGALSGGLFSVTVTSWSGISRRVLDDLGDRRAFLSDQGRVMLLRRCADECAKDLTVFKRSALFEGFPAACDELIRKFKRCGFSSADIGEAAEKLEEGLPLRDKLSDISVIFSDLERRCESRYIDPEDMMNEMLRRMGESRLRGAHVFIDGGDTVNEQAYPVFSGLLDCAASVHIALNCDLSSRDRSVFSPELRIFERLKKTAEQAGAEYSITRLTERKRPGTPAIRHLERELFSFPYKAFEGIPEGLSISIRADRSDEVTEAAETILKAAENGMRFCDMAVIVSDMAGYTPFITRIFSEYGIPFFTDVKRSLTTHPAAQLILSALKAAESGFGIESVIEAVKTGYLDITPEEAERFENYLLFKGFYGSSLARPFPEDGAELEDIRVRVMEPLTAFREQVRVGSCEARTRAIHSFLEALDVYSKQRALCEELHKNGQFLEEEENAQIVNTIIEVLDQLFVIMGDEDIGLKRFSAVVKEGFSSYEVGVIPTTCDQVLVGSMDRTRSREVKLLYVLGMNDGLFPVRRADDGVIDDGDLKRLSEHGYELWRSSKSLSEGDLLTVYSALAKATERIVFSYPVSVTGSGDAALPCALVGSVKRVFPMIPVYEGILDPGVRSNEKAAFASLAKRLRRLVDTGSSDEETARLWSYFSRSPEYRERLMRIASACFGDAELKPFGTELAKKLYGTSIYGSASRLETFNSCPFRHFMQYGIGAKERRLHRMEQTTKGSFRHAALEAYVNYVVENGLDWKEIDDEKTFEILREIIPPIMNAEGSGMLYDTARQRHELVTIVETIKYTCCAITRHIAAGSFRPSGCEVSFGKPDSLFPPIVITSSDGTAFRITGVIDRIDSFTNSAGNTMSRVVDYKSYKKEFDYAHLNAGLQLQLPLYAAAIDAAETVGMYYMRVMDIPPVTSENGEVVKVLTDELMTQFKLNGVSLRDEEVIAATDEFDKSSLVINARRLNSGEIVCRGFADRDEYALVIETARKRSAAALERIFEGADEVSPYEAVYNSKDNSCGYCPYGDVCRFDPDLSPKGFRRLYRISPDTFFGREKPE